MGRVVDRRARLAYELRGAIGRGEIAALFQPQYSLLTGEIAAAEALSRWHNPELGQVSPAEFIPIAEESEMINEIGEHMLELGVRAAIGWRNAGTPIEVAVNVSLRQLQTGGLPSSVESLLTDHSLDPHLLTLEVTESTSLEQVPTAVSILAELREHGVNISVDDFGTAFSSREQVSALPATELKIDQELVRSNDTDGEEKLASAISFGKERGLRIVAEGVETTDQLERVRSLGSDRVQGFLLSRPVDISRLDEQLSRTG